MSKEYENYWLKKGTILRDKYRIDDVISEGGFGIVYLGYDLILEMEVAIKEYFPRNYVTRDLGKMDLHIYEGEAKDFFSAGIEKFLAEARVMAKFHDLEHIVTIHDFFYANQTAYLISEHVVGTALDVWIRENGPMEAQQVLTIMKPIMNSLSVIHESGLIHRDISPHNIIMKGENSAVLIDFGAARLSNSQSDLTMTVYFKRGYSAYEQYLSNEKQGPYTDIYALGATMYYMLTGIKPDESAKRHIKDMVVPLWEMKDVLLQAHQAKAIMKSMAVDAFRRYATIEPFMQELYEGKSKTRRIGRAVILTVCAGLILLYGVYAILTRKAPKEGTEVPAPFATQETLEVSPTPKQEAQEEKTVDSPKPVVQYELPNVVGMKRNKACKLIQSMTDKKVKIKVKYEYSEEMAKGRVIKQSKKEGTYREGSLKSIILQISKGIYISNTPSPTTKPVSISGGRTKDREKNKTNKGKETLAGNLPW